MYSIVFTDLSKKQLNKFPKVIRQRIINTLKRCRIRPHAYIKKLTGNKYFRLRVGDYRVIIDIQDNEFRILVIEMAHRKKIYKNG